MSDDLLASVGSFSCHVWSLATHVSRASVSAWQGSSSSHQGQQWAARPKGPLLWFHALTLGETAVVLPVVFRCLLEYNEHVHVLLTTKSAEAISLLSSSLPPRVIVQDVPLDSYVSMGRFLAHFQPQACILMESPAWPVLVESCASRGIKLGLLNARMSSRAFLSWFQRRVSRALLHRMLANFSLIVPQSDIDVGRFRIFGATLLQMPGWCSDLKYAAALGNSVWHLWRPKPSRIASLHGALCGRPLWVAAHTQPGEEEAVAAVHSQVAKDWPSLLTVLAPAASGRCGEVVEMLESTYSLKVLVWSSVVDMIAPQAHKQHQQQQQQPSQSSSWLRGWRGGAADSQQRRQQQQGQDAAAAAAAAAGSSGSPGAVDPAMLLKGVNVLLLDLQADLPLMYSVSEVAFIGSSLLEGCSGHNLAEAAVAGCAVLVGEHAGHFSTMADELNQAAIVAAEEASAAVNSSGPMEDPFFAAGETGGSAAPSTAAAAAAAAGAGAGTSGAGAASSAAAAAAAGGSSSATQHAVVEGGESEEPSPRDGSHWRGVLNYTQHEDGEQQGQYADSSAGGSRDGYSSMQHLQQQQHQQLQQLLQEQSSLRPSSAPAAVSSSGVGAAPGSGSSPANMPPPPAAGTRAAAPTPDSSSLGGYGPPGARNTAALMYRRHARTGSSANSSCVGSPVASQRPSTAGGSAYSQQQQPQQSRQEDGGSSSYLQQYQSQQQQQQQQRTGSPLQQQSNSTEQPAPQQQQDQAAGQDHQQQQQQAQQQQQQPAAQAAAEQQQRGAASSSGGGCEECGPQHRRCPAVDRPVPQAPPPSAATNTPVNGPTGNVTPVTPAGSFGGADPALLQQPDSRDLAQRLAQQQQQQRGSDAGGAQQQQAADGKQRQQQAAAGGSSGGGAPQGAAGGQARQPELQLQLQQLRGNSSSGGGASNAASTPLSGVTDLYSVSFPTSPRGAHTVPQTPNTTPADSAHAMGGRSPMLSCAGIEYAPNLASLALQTAPVEVVHDLPSAEPSWQSACSSSNSACVGGSSGGCAGSSGGSTAVGAGHGENGHLQHEQDPLQQEQQGRCSEHAADPSLLQRPACPSPPEDPCFSRASAASSVSGLPVFSNSSSATGSSRSGSGSRSRLGRATSSSGWQEEQQRLRHQQHLQGVVNGVWRGGSEGGSPMVAALADAAAAAGEDSSDEEEERARRLCNGGRSPRQRPASPPAAAADGLTTGSAETGSAGQQGGEAGAAAVSLNGRGLSAESSGVFDGSGDETDGSGRDESNDGGSRRPEGVVSSSEELLPFSRSPTFAELAACNVLGSSTDGSPTAQQSGSTAGGSKGSLQQLAAGVVVSASIAGGAVSAREAVLQPSSNGCSRTSSQEVAVPDLCPTTEQQQQQQLEARLASDQGSVGWEDWGHSQQQQQHQQCNGVAELPTAHVPPNGCSSSGDGAQGGAAGSSSRTPAAAALMRASDGGAGGGTSRLGDPRRSRHFLDLPSETSSVAGEDLLGEIQPAEQQQQQPGLLPSQQQLQSLHQPQLLSYSGTGSGSAGTGTAGPSGAGTDGGGGVHSSSSGGGGAAHWLEPHHAGAATPPSWAATPRSTPHQQYPYSASTTPSAGVTPRGPAGRGHGGRSSSSSHQHHHAPHHHHQQSGRRSVDLHHQQHHHQHHHQMYAHLHQQQHLVDGSSGGGSGMYSPLSRLADGSTYRRADSLTSMTSFATSAGGDRDRDPYLHDDQPGSSRMSLMGEGSHLGGFSTTGGGRFSGFTGVAGFASTGRFSECATPRSTVTDVFRGQSEPQVACVGAGGGDAGLLNRGTSYLRYRGEYILPATHLPAAPQGPAVWRVSGEAGLSLALSNLLQEPLERRSRGHAAAQAAAKLASGLVSTVWHVVDDMVVTPALQDFVAQGGLNGDAAVQHAARAARIPGHPRI